MRKPKTAPAKAFADAVLSFVEIIYCFRNYMTNHNNRSTFRFSEKYFMLRVLLRDQKYQKSSKTFPLRNLPVSPRFAKARPAPWLCQRTDFIHARHTFICGRGFSHTRICSATSCDVFARVV